MFRVHTLRALKDNFIYVLINPDGRCAVVDPGESSPVIELLRSENLRLTHVLCTHHHHDHIDGAATLREKSGCEVVCSTFDRPRISAATVAVDETTGFNLWERPIQILEMPGHTLGQIAYYAEPEQALFTGDTLFSGGCGRLFEGTPAQMFDSLAKLKRLPRATKVYFGHEYTLRNLDFIMTREPRPEVDAYRRRCAERVAQGEVTTPSTLATELDINPFLRASDVASFTEWRTARNTY